MASETVGNILCMIACLSIQSHPQKSLVRKQALRQGCSVLFCGVSSQISSYVRMRLASSPLSPPDQQHPAAENLTGPHACIALCGIRESCLVFCCDSLTTHCPTISPLSFTPNRRPPKPNLGLGLRLNESVPRSIERHTPIGAVHTSSYPALANLPPPKDMKET